MKIFGLKLSWNKSKKSSRQQQNAMQYFNQNSFPRGPPPSYHSVICAGEPKSRSTAFPLVTHQIGGTTVYTNPFAQSFPADWKRSLGPKRSRLRSLSHSFVNENTARRS
ncbi:hypothetical protein O181_011755 [Austropuccinia psidii MF-1]|uniref:Uncharacterized protein n=1 Tax=Austropuccinia psidii MF-1 TaxID=1389203 RepID=A0A9Q3BVR7_9BASI|nr:hypothetical protein [Austropuccinia psidii MF-1]